MTRQVPHGAMPNPSTDPPNLIAALAHAAKGRPVFPCDPRNKRPAIPKREGGNGFKDASKDPAQLRAWWARYPDAVPGMPTGGRVGVWVLDVDNKPGKLGDETLARLIETFGPLPETVETITATGGRHLFFRHPRDGRLVPNSASQLGQGGETWGEGGYPEVPFERSAGGKLATPDLDIRGDGGYVILPGATMADGRRYEWEGSSDPDEGATVAEPPPWLLALVVHDPVAARTAVAGSVAHAEPIAEGQRNDCLYRLGCSLRTKGLCEEAIVAALQAENVSRCTPPLPSAEVAATARSAASKPSGLSPEYEANRRPPADRPQSAKPKTEQPDLRVVGGTDYDARPEVQLRSGELPLSVDQVEDYLIRAGADMYQHGTRLVRVGQWEAVAGPINRPSGSGVLVDISSDWLVDQCTRKVDFKRFDKRAAEWRSVDCPTRIAATLLARIGSWRFPVLTGFCDSPTLDLDGRIVFAPGYDPPSGLYLSHPPTLPPMMTTARSDAQGAGETLYCAVDTFPFVTSADASACLALIMTALLRRVLPAAPIGCISSSTPGMGKSKLVDVVAAIATGRSASVMALGQTPEELEKRLDSVLLKGDLLCSFDNVTRAVRSDVLCQVATQRNKSIRVLALSKIVEAPTNVALFMTGNNLTLVDDLTRRCLVVNVDAGCERPELREFDRDAVEHVLDRRAEFIAAALAISKTYLDAGCPKVDALPFGSFETWDRMVRRPLMWAGWPDPLDPAAAMRDQDHELTGTGDFLRAWLDAHPQPLTASELSELIRERVPRISDGWMPAHPALTEAAIQVMGDLNKWGGRELGYRLRERQNRLYGGLRIVKTKKSKRGMMWIVENVQGAG